MAWCCDCSRLTSILVTSHTTPSQHLFHLQCSQPPHFSIRAWSSIRWRSSILRVTQGGTRLDRFTRCRCVHTAMANGSSLNILCLQSFSSIVGPNGSGKSNTIDALLFMFGYRASKMRQGILSELIHNSAWYPDLDDCSVKVHFREIVDLVRWGILVESIHSDSSFAAWPRCVQCRSQLKAHCRVPGLQEQHEQVYDQWQNE